MLRPVALLVLPLALCTTSAYADTLVDCSQDRFKSTNSPKSLMGWSRRHFETAKKAKAEGNTSGMKRSCDDTVKMRGSAHCQGPEDADIRKALQAALDLCTVDETKSAPPKEEPSSKPQEGKPAAKAQIDCSLPQYQSGNSARSLSGWADGLEEGVLRQKKQGVFAESECKSLIAQRGAAHCKEPGEAKYANLFKKAVELCKAPAPAKGKTLVDCANKRFHRPKTPTQTLINGAKLAVMDLDTTEDFRIKHKCVEAETLGGAAHCKDPNGPEAKAVLQQTRAKCAGVVETRAKKRAAASAAEKKRQEDALKNRKIVSFPRSTFKGGGRGGVEAQMKKALITGRVAKSAGDVLRVQAMGGWQPGRYVDTKVQYRKIMGTVLWKSSRSDGVCRFTSYKFVQDKAGGSYGPLRFKAFCNGCPEGWTKCR